MTMACPPDCDSCSTAVREKRTADNEMWSGLVDALTRILSTPREPEDAARNVLAYVRVNYDVAVKPESRIR